jgi:hypothetical protein
MLRREVFAAVLALAGTAAVFPPPSSVAPPPLGHTGGFGEPSCVVCHLGSEVNAFGGRVSVEGLPAAYRPGTDYALTVVLAADETAVAGFQLTSRYAGGGARGGNAGRLRPVDRRVAVSDSNGVSYGHHTQEGTIPPSPEGSSWSLVWMAPLDGGPVTINVAANSGNADNSPLSDLVYVHEVIVPAGRRSVGPGGLPDEGGGRP